MYGIHLRELWIACKRDAELGMRFILKTQVIASMSPAQAGIMQINRRGTETIALVIAGCSSFSFRNHDKVQASYVGQRNESSFLVYISI